MKHCCIFFVITERCPLPDGFYVYKRLNERGIAIKSTPAPDSLIVRLASPKQTFGAREALLSSLTQEKIITQQPSKPASFWRQKLTQKHLPPEPVPPKAYEIEQ
ncbi:MAG: hypothetical protein ACSLEN_00515 [Candidatus Malihini olakiniferum]